MMKIRARARARASGVAETIGGGRRMDREVVTKRKTWAKRSLWWGMEGMKKMRIYGWVSRFFRMSLKRRWTTVTLLQ